ncbi:MAG: NAD(P)/FAD-dependent oxidoreductase [Alphaproteobacteria bacterium]
MNGRKRIAVVGGGIAGLGAAWLLARRHDVVVYEAADRPGGHSHTVEVDWRGRGVPVDTGFIVYNEVNYPLITRLFAWLQVPTEASDMSFAVSVDGGNLEYASTGLAGLFAQAGNIARPRFLAMLVDLFRFYREAPRILDRPDAGLTLGDFLAAGRYGEPFVRDHLLPMAAAIWSCPMATMLDFPAVSFVRFCHNHGLLRVSGRPQWRTVSGGSRAYVRRLVDPFAWRLRLGAPVARIRRGDVGVEITDRPGTVERFDQAVVATHADEALALLADPSPEEAAALGAFRYAANRTILHSDAGLMPRRPRAWSSWNYISEGRADARGASVTYWMNRLQNLTEAPPLFVSLNPLREPDDRKVHGEWTYMHPIFDRAAIAAQARLDRLQGARGTWFCGSYCGYGFHEDAFASAVRVATALEAPPPWLELGPTAARAA